jgi:tRNA(fMet)-specific endonuclease VapC
MKFIVDTDHLALIQQQSQPEFGRIADRMSNYSRRDFYVSIVSFHEQVLGWTTYLSRSKSREDVVKAYSKLRRLLTDFAALQVLPFDDVASDSFETLRRRRIRIGTMDLRIAATALGQNATVLTRNLVDFRKVPGLHVEDWTVESQEADS